MSRLSNYLIKRPPSGVAGQGARATLNGDVLAQYSGGVNPATWNLFNNMTV